MGGSECTILAHIPIGSNLVSIQNKKHLHWKVVESISSMNNEIEFVAPAHNLLLKKGVEGEEGQVHKNKAASRQTSLQAARKKHFTPLVATPLWPSVGVKPNTWKSWRFGVLRDSRMFRA
jgi:hypothetical protein